MFFKPYTLLIIRLYFYYMRLNIILKAYFDLGVILGVILGTILGDILGTILGDIEMKN